MRPVRPVFVPPSLFGRAAPSRPPLNRRRALLRGGQGLLALAVLGAAVPACDSSGSAEPDPLESELAAARSDAALATAVALATPALAPALRVIADERTRHATALVEEMARAAGRPTPAPDSAEAGATATAAATASAAGRAPADVREVAEALRRSAADAAKLAPTLSGYRAGLVGSIAAACTTAHTVGLTPLPRPQ